MPALNPRQLVINTIWTVLEARPAFAAAVKEANRIKTSDLLQLEREALGLQATGQFPRAYCTANAATVSAPPITFKFGSATATVDYAVPMDAAIELKIVHERLEDGVRLTLEGEVDAALHGLHVALHAAGYRWSGVVTWRLVSRNEKNADTANAIRPVSRWTITVRCRPLASALAAA